MIDRSGNCLPFVTRRDKSRQFLFSQINSCPANEAVAEDDKGLNYIRINQTTSFPRHVIPSPSLPAYPPARSTQNGQAGGQERGNLIINI
jgi:hypothetical protein